MRICQFQPKITHFSQRKLFSEKSLIWLIHTVILDPKWLIYPDHIIFFWKTINSNFIYMPFGPFYCTKLKKNNLCGSRVMKSHHFQAQNNPFAQNNFFFRKTINEIFMYLLLLTTFTRTKMTCLPRKRIFSENPLVKLVVFICVYLKAKNQSQMSI